MSYHTHVAHRTFPLLSFPFFLFAKLSRYFEYDHSSDFFEILHKSKFIKPDQIWVFDPGPGQKARCGQGYLTESESRVWSNSVAKR